MSNYYRTRQLKKIFNPVQNAATEVSEVCADIASWIFGNLAKAIVLIVMGPWVLLRFSLPYIRNFAYPVYNATKIFLKAIFNFILFLLPVWISIGSLVFISAIVFSICQLGFDTINVETILWSAVLVGAIMGMLILLLIEVSKHCTKPTNRKGGYKK